MVLRVRVGDPRSGPIFRFDAPSFTIGRTAENNLVLPDESVALRHARVERSPGAPSVYLVVDEQTQQRKAVYEDQPFTIGTYELRILEREPPDDEEQRFLDALLRGPTDDATRAVYADWLEERGRAAEAEFLRAQVEIRTLGVADRRFEELAERVRAIGGGLSGSWRRTVARPPVENCGVRFEVSCPKAWDKMAPTANPDERHCGTCDRTVYYARDVKEVYLHAMKGRCVAVDVVQVRRKGDLDPPPPLRTAGIPAPMLAPPPRK